MSPPGTPTDARRARLRRAAALAAVCAAAIWCYAPALHAYFAQDDFTLLALARLLHEPRLVFYHDHFPGSLFFRPLGVFAWWLTTAAFDNAPRGHYAFNLLLHLCAVAALYRLLQRLRRDGPLNIAWAALYAVHPLAIGTALWLSDRFDLIATTFSLLALSAAVDWTRAPGPRPLARVLAFVVLAFMGKEIAIVGAIAAAALIALPNAADAPPRRERWTAACIVLATTVAWLAYRHLLMAKLQNPLLEPGTLVATFVKGIGLWCRIGVEYLAVDPRVGGPARVLLALAALLFAGAVARGRRDAAAIGWGVGAALLIAIALPGPTQAPVVAISTSDLGPQTFWFDLIGESRLYHLSLAALIALLMLATTPRAGAVRAARPRLAGAGIAVALVALIPASHRIAHDFARSTRAQIAPLRAANAAIERLPLPEHGCRIFLLGAGELWGWGGLGDPMIKASSAAPQRLESCLVNTERTPWANFVRSGSVDAASVPPLRPLTANGRPIPWLVLDGFEALYLNLDGDIDARAMPSAFFLDYRDGAFVDVSAAVRDGTRPVRFFNARPAEK